mmetsp:Transcript_18238/g.59667  ORF Transcript_18238/g.59667 Transcript_18238/m.59667 type:complete len:285 (-) Transcript_18238:180-1034(-)
MDRYAHCLPGGGVGDGLVHGTAGETDGARGDGGAGVVESAHRNLESEAHVAQPVRVWNQHILKRDATRVGAPLAHVDLLAADSDARRVCVDDEGSEGLAGRGGRVRLGQHEEPVGHASIRDPHLVAVEHPRVPLAHGRGFGRGHIRSRPRLGHAVGGLQRLLRHPPEILLLLLVRAGDNHRSLGQAVGLHGSHDTRAPVRQLLADDDALRAAETEAAVVLGDVRVHQAELPRFVEHLGRVLHGAIVIGRHRDHLVRRKPPSQVFQRGLLLRQTDGEAVGRFACR